MKTTRTGFSITTQARQTSLGSIAHTVFVSEIGFPSNTLNFPSDTLKLELAHAVWPLNFTDAVVHRLCCNPHTSLHGLPSKTPFIKSQLQTGHLLMYGKARSVTSWQDTHSRKLPAVVYQTGNLLATTAPSKIFRCRVYMPLWYMGSSIRASVSVHKGKAHSLLGCSTS